MELTIGSTEDRKRPHCGQGGNLLTAANFTSRSRADGKTSLSARIAVPNGTDRPETDQSLAPSVFCCCDCSDIRSSISSSPAGSRSEANHNRPVFGYVAAAQNLSQ